VQEALARQLGSGAREHFCLPGSVTNVPNTKADEDVGSVNNALGGNNAGCSASTEHLDLGSVAGAVAFILSAEAAPGHRSRRGQGQGHWRAGGGGESPELRECRHRRDQKQQQPQPQPLPETQQPQDQQQQRLRAMLPKGLQQCQQSGPGNHTNNTTTINNNDNWKNENIGKSTAAAVFGQISTIIDKR
ncbi:hypothetical protein Vretifemale_16708, partial [Volvox reticuliferus]